MPKNGSTKFSNAWEWEVFPAVFSPIILPSKKVHWVDAGLLLDIMKGFGGVWWRLFVTTALVFKFNVFYRLLLMLLFF